MSYIAVDLKVIEVHAPGIARALELDVTHVLGSLTLLWHRCWSTKSDTLPKVALRGYFPGDAAAVLVAFGILEDAGETYRVKGADRYLRLFEQRQKAGRSRSSSAGRSAGRYTSEKPAARQRRTSGAPAESQRPTSSYTEHRAPNTKEGAPEAPSRPSDALCDDFRAATGSAYLWQGAKDGAALADLLKASTLDEVRARWRRGLARPPDDWLGIRTVAQLRQKWNDLATDSPKQQRDPNAGLEKPTRYLG